MSNDPFNNNNPFNQQTNPFNNFNEIFANAFAGFPSTNIPTLPNIPIQIPTIPHNIPQQRQRQVTFWKTPTFAHSGNNLG